MEKRKRGRPPKNPQTPPVVGGKEDITVRRRWRPASRIFIPEEFKNPRFVYYAASKDDLNIRKKLQEYWEIDHEIAPKMRKAGMLPDLPATIQDGQQRDTTLQFRELIILRMPKELMEEKKEYLARKADAMIGVKEEKLEQETDGRAYGKVKVER
jgi:hypothetical protein